MESLTATLPLERVDAISAAFCVREPGSSYPTYPVVTLTREQWEELGAPTKIDVHIYTAAS